MVDAPRPKWLIGRERNQDGRNAGAKAGGGGTSAAVMDDGGHARIKPRMRRRFKSQELVGIGNRLQTAPSGKKETA